MYLGFETKQNVNETFFDPGKETNCRYTNDTFLFCHLTSYRFRPYSVAYFDQCHRICNKLQYLIKTI